VARYFGCSLQKAVFIIQQQFTGDEEKEEKVPENSDLRGTTRPAIKALRKKSKILHQKSKLNPAVDGFNDHNPPLYPPCKRVPDIDALIVGALIADSSSDNYPPITTELEDNKPHILTLNGTPYSQHFVEYKRAPSLTMVGEKTGQKEEM